MGLCIAPLFPTGISLVARRTAITGQVMGWFFVGASLGGMSLPLLMGQLFERVGPQAAILAILVDMLLALGVFIFIKLRFPRLSAELPESSV
jgi:fucose permease